MIPELPGSRHHGDAWRAFCSKWRAVERNPEGLEAAWNFFLAGWRAKILQQQGLRKRIPR